MATTTPFPFAEVYDPAAHSEERQTIVARLIELYESALGDSDKAAAGEDAGFYDGQQAAYFDALAMLTGADSSLLERYGVGEDVTRSVIRRTLHIGVDPRNLLTVLRGGVGWIVDGDGWNCWGEAINTDVNDDRTLHLIHPEPMNVAAALTLVAELGTVLVPMSEQSSGNTSIAVLTDSHDWSETQASILDDRTVVEHGA